MFSFRNPLFIFQNNNVAAKASSPEDDKIRRQELNVDGGVLITKRVLIFIRISGNNAAGIRGNQFLFLFLRLLKLLITLVLFRLVSIDNEIGIHVKIVLKVASQKHIKLISEKQNNTKLRNTVKLCQ